MMNEAKSRAYGILHPAQCLRLPGYFFVPTEKGRVGGWRSQRSAQVFVIGGRALAKVLVSEEREQSSLCRSFLYENAFVF